MGKAKTLLREHDEAIVRLAEKLMGAYEIYENSPITTCEFVGNLEALKHMAFEDAHEDVRGMDESLVDELLDTIFGGEGE